jgi:DNA polymerase III subunit epsilon
MRLAGQYLSCARRSLASCCESAGVSHTDAHSALHDARACANLFAYFIQATPRPEPWAELLAQVLRLTWPTLPRGVRRAVSRGMAAPAKSFLARMIDRLPRVNQPPQADDYLALLDRALLDRYLSASEQDALLELAGELRLTFADTMELHRAYLVSLAEAAWQDGVVTEAERRDLLAVAELLGLSRQDVDIALETTKGRQGSMRPGQFRLAPGDFVAFTGQMCNPREDWEARATRAGLRVHTVTRRTRLLVAADPDSLSGKAGTARKYGIPIVTEEAFERLLVQVGGTGRA